MSIIINSFKTLTFLTFHTFSWTFIQLTNVTMINRDSQLEKDTE